MRLEKCYIENFGKLSDFSYDFDSKINIIEEKNGYGKSTLCAFIKAMFYGLQGVRIKSLEENERKMFLPWQGGNFGGYLDFCANEKRYRIERKFGETAKGDKFSLIDLLSGEQSADFSENIGEELFGIDVNGFEKCTYYTSSSAEKAVPASILAKLFDNSDNINAFENALKRLEKKEKYYQTARNTGIIPTMQAKLSHLQTQTFELEEKIKSADEIKANLNLLNKQKSDLEKQLESVRKEISDTSKSDAQLEVAKEKIKYYNSLVQKKNQAKENIDLISKRYKNDLPSEEKINEISSLVEKNRQLNAVKHKKFSFILPIAIAVLSVLFLVFSFVFTKLFIPFIICFGVAFFTSVAGLFIVISANKKEEKSKIEKENLNNSIKTAFSEILVLPDDDFDDNIKLLNKDFYEIRQEKKNYEEYLNQAKDYYNKMNLGEFKDGVKSTSSTELESKEKQILSKINDISYQTINLNNSLEKIEFFEDELLEIRREFDKMSEELKISQENYQAIVIAKDLILKSNDNLTLKYKEKISNNFVENLKLAFDNCEAVLSNNFDVKISEAGEFREIHSFSSGQKTAIELALRLSIIDSIFENEKPFIILDDSFNNLDDDAFKSITQKLREISQNIQIIYFTCSKSRIF